MSKLILNNVYPGSRVAVFRTADLKRMDQLNVSKFDHEDVLKVALVNEIVYNSPILLEYDEQVTIRCRCATHYYAKSITHIMSPHEEDIIITQQPDY